MSPEQRTVSVEGSKPFRWFMFGSFIKMQTTLTTKVMQWLLVRLRPVQSLPQQFQPLPQED